MMMMILVCCKTRLVGLGNLGATRKLDQEADVPQDEYQAQVDTSLAEQSKE
jgi:hypothetical protein